MNKSRIISIVLLCLVLCLSSCKKQGNTDETSTSAVDWRNKTEYEGSFYVSHDIKLLYALDKGTITLWDNNGNGEILQTLKYETTESDAIERLDNKDVNVDGYNDISTVYSDDGVNTRYNLWLWNTAQNKYTACNIYKSIYNPVVADDGKSVSGSLNMGIFGVVNSYYVFRDAVTLELVSTDLANADDIAIEICSVILPQSTVRQTDGEATIQDETCTVYGAWENEKETAYIAYTENANWYIDIGCIGAYRIITDNNGSYTTGTYIDDAGKAVELCSDLFGNENGEYLIKETAKGFIDNSPAKSFVMTRGGNELCCLMKSEKGFWYYSVPNDRVIYNMDISGTAKIAEETTLRFIPQQ